jgi:D-alanyl-D-alanine carboxypeptidase/D-alanyl-D-alanine-endopeptidase (penicillin-binding protein 4)
VAIAGCGGGDHAAKPSSQASVASPSPATTTPLAHTNRTKPKPPAPTPQLLHLRAQLDRLFANAGGGPGSGSGALVYDLTAKQPLFSLDAGVGRPPASVEKLYTTAAVLDRLGPAARLSTSILATGALGAGGVWHGNLYLRGGGDPTFGDGTFNRLYERGYGPTAAQLAQQLLARGIRRVTGRLYGDESLFSTERGGMLTSLAPDIPDFGGELSALTYDHGQTVGSRTPAAFAAREVAATLSQMGVRVRASRLTRTTPPGAQPLASVHSPPIEDLLALMNVPSDDLFAEMLTEQLGVRFGAGGSIASGARVIAATIAADYGLHPLIFDGSGLDRADRSSPLQVLSLLRELWGTPTGKLLYQTLPVVGVNGTVAGIADRTAAAGHCAAKTGTLDGVSNLAGYCHARDGHELAFVMMVVGPPNWSALAEIGKMVAAVARY